MELDKNKIIDQEKYWECNIVAVYTVQASYVTEVLRKGNASRKKFLLFQQHAKPMKVSTSSITYAPLGQRP